MRTWPAPDRRRREPVEPGAAAGCARPFPLRWPKALPPVTGGRGRRARAVKTAKYERRYTPEIVADLAALREFDPALLAAALAAIEDLAFGRQRGKLLGDRHVSGDLTGLARPRFDLPGQHPTRYRIVYRLIENDTVIEVLAADGAHRNPRIRRSHTGGENQ